MASPNIAPLASAQIILCSYMCVEAFMIANRSGYPTLPCAAFDAKNPAVANVLWLFYVSKVCVLLLLGRLITVCLFARYGTAGYEACVLSDRTICARKPEQLRSACHVTAILPCYVRSPSYS